MAAPSAQTDCPESLLDFVWREKPANDFVILYTASHVSLAEQIHQNYTPVLEAEITRYQQAFGSELLLPITIRIYPSPLEYYCLNPQAPALGPEDLHSHIGEREIALIANVINRSPTTWETRAVNALRHEIAILFGEQLSAGEAPPGLLQGLGGYFEDPAETFPARYQAAGSPVRPDRGWQRLWEEDVSVSDSLVFLQQTSISAFLIDIYGWEQFTAFLRRIPEVQGYRQASQDVYGENLQDLYAYWQRYANGTPAPVEDWHELVQTAQRELMNSPGHRETILNPENTAVGIGMAYHPELGEFRLAQEFIQEYLDQEPLPETAQPGEVLEVRSRLLNGAADPLINLDYEPFPEPMSVEKLRQTGEYRSQAVFILAETPAVAEGQRYRADIILPLGSRAGYYHVRTWVSVAGEEVLAGDVVVTVKGESGG